MALNRPPTTSLTGHAICYQLQIRKCGKCKTCMEGPGHGPYWYAFWRIGDGKLKSAYVGKYLKAEIAYQAVMVGSLSPEDSPVPPAHRTAQ